MRRLVITALLLAIPVGACKTGGSGTDADAQDGTVDAEPEDTGDAQDPTFEPHCCPLDSPSCDCPHIGGTPDERGECATVCNVRPEGWLRMVDDGGCFYWRIPDDARSCSEDDDGEPEPAVETEDEPEPAEETETSPEPPPGADTD